jgi:hypothetical protein
MSQSGPILGGSSSIPSNVAQAYATNSGTAIPAANILNVVGSGATTTSGSGNTLTINTPLPFTPNSTVTMYEEFCGYFVNTGQYVGQLGIIISGSISQAFTTATTTSNSHPGVIHSSEISAADSFKLILMAHPSPIANNFILGGGILSINWIVNIATLSDVTNAYTLYVGLGNATASASEPTDGVYFAYTHATNSGNWVGKTSNASSRSSANSSDAVSAGAWVNLGITVNADATSVSFYVNGVEIANSPLATNIPTVAINPFLLAVRSAGTVPANAIRVDAFYLTQTLTTPR